MMRFLLAVFVAKAEGYACGNDHVILAPGAGWGCSHDPTANTVYKNLHIKFKMEIGSSCSGSGSYRAQVHCDGKTSTLPSDTDYWYDSDGHQTDFGVSGAWSCGKSFRFEMWTLNNGCTQTWQQWGLTWDEISSMQGSVNNTAVETNTDVPSGTAANQSMPVDAQAQSMDTPGQPCPFCHKIVNSQGVCQPCLTTQWAGTCSCGPGASDWIKADQCHECTDVSHPESTEPDLPVDAQAQSMDTPGQPCPFCHKIVNSQGVCQPCLTTQWAGTCSCGPGGSDWIKADQCHECTDVSDNIVV